MSWKRTKFRLLPTSGSVGGGIRNSKEFTNAAVPPTGNPVCKSLGPAPLIGNPRSELAPPAYNRSGSGTETQLGLVFNKSLPSASGFKHASFPTFGFGPHDCSNAIRVFRAITYFSLPNW